MNNANFSRLSASSTKSCTKKSVNGVLSVHGCMKGGRGKYVLIVSPSIRGRNGFLPESPIGRSSYKRIRQCVHVIISCRFCTQLTRTQRTRLPRTRAGQFRTSSGMIRDICTTVMNPLHVLTMPSTRTRKDWLTDAHSGDDSIHCIAFASSVMLRMASPSGKYAKRSRKLFSTPRIASVTRWSAIL